MAAVRFVAAVVVCLLVVAHANADVDAAAAAEPAMAEPQLVETVAVAEGVTAAEDTEGQVEAAAAALSDGHEDLYTPPRHIPGNFNTKPKIRGKRGFWATKKRIVPAVAVGKQQMQDIIAYDAEAAKHAMKPLTGLKRVHYGETKGPKLVRAYYHTARMTSPVQDKITADVRGSDGAFVEPEVIGHVPTKRTHPRPPKYHAPAYLPRNKKPLRRWANNKPLHKHTRVHIIRRNPITGQIIHTKKNGKVKSVKAAKPVPKSGVVAPRPLVRRAKHGKRRASNPNVRRAIRRAIKQAVRRAQLRRERARQAAAVIRVGKKAGAKKAKAVSPAPAKPAAAAASASAAATAVVVPVPVPSAADVAAADKEAKQLSATAATVSSIKADTNTLVTGQKRLIEYARTATRSNPIAERAVAVDETILKHVTRLEDAVTALLKENAAMHEMQRANLRQLSTMQAAIATVNKNQKAAATAARAAANVKRFPHLKAVSAVITPEERVSEVDSEHEAAAEAFHATLTEEHTSSEALDATLTRFAEVADESDAADADAGAADATAKTEEEVAMERLMTGLLQQTETEADTDAEEETEAETNEAEAETETEAEEEVESEDAADEEAEAPEAEAMVETQAAAVEEDETEEEEEIDAESTVDDDILRLAERNAAMVEQEAHRTAVAVAVAAQNEETLSADEDMSDSAVTEAAASLGLPSLPASVPVEHHDDMTEVEAEVDAEESAEEARFAQVHADVDVEDDSEMDAEDELEVEDASEAEVDVEDELEVEGEAEADAEGEAEAEVNSDAEFEALVNDESEEDASIASDIEHELANEDAADVDLNDESADVAEVDSEMAAALAQNDGFSAAENAKLHDLRALVASLSGQIAEVKAAGAAMAMHA